jgi:ligand-binding sensor domain-containing protein
LYCGIITHDESIALGTLHGGLLIIDKKGNPELNLNTENGLQNNSILSMKTDNLDNLWLAMDQGIDYMELSSPFSKMKTKQLEGNVYSVILLQLKFQISMQQMQVYGLYHIMHLKQIHL